MNKFKNINRTTKDNKHKTIINRVSPTQEIKYKTNAI